MRRIGVLNNSVAEAPLPLRYVAALAQVRSTDPSTRSSRSSRKSVRPRVCYKNIFGLSCEPLLRAFRAAPSQSAWLFSLCTSATIKSRRAFRMENAVASCRKARGFGAVAPGISIGRVPGLVGVAGLALYPLPVSVTGRERPVDFLILTGSENRGLSLAPSSPHCPRNRARATAGHSEHRRLFGVFFPIQCPTAFMTLQPRRWQIGYSGKPCTCADLMPA